MKKMNYEEVYPIAYADFNDDIATQVWLGKYAMKDDNGYYLEKNSDEMFKRIAGEFARIEKKYREEIIDKQIPEEKFNELSELGKKYVKNGLTENDIFNLMHGFNRIIPQGSVLSQLGHKYSIGSLSNCTVIDSPEDSYNGIILTDLEMANLMKRRCGVGVDISTLRPDTAKVSNAASSSTGAVSFMERYSNTTKEVSQNGRRGALMCSLDINHCDVNQFATIKNDPYKVTNANISIRISDEFMQAVENDTDFLHIWPIHEDKSKFNLNEIPYNQTITFDDKVYIRKVRAKALWNVIVTSARNHAEPGIIYWDRQHKYSTSSFYNDFENISTNPCSEIAMGKSDSCRLISTNLFSHVENPFTIDAKFNFNRWYETIYYAQILNDDLVDLEVESIDRILEKIEQDTESNKSKQLEQDLWLNFKDIAIRGRRTGLGFTGLGDTLAALGLKYDSNESLYIIELIMQEKLKAEFNASIDMAIIRGQFKDFNVDIENKSDFIAMIRHNFNDMYKRMMKHGRRNISISTCAPNGSISLLAGNLTSGIEPLFMPFYTRRKKVNPSDVNVKIDYKDNDGNSWQEFNIIHPPLKKWITINYPDVNIDNLTKNELTKLFNKSPYFESTAHDIDWGQRLLIQGLIQKYITHSISSTLNLHENVENEIVSDIYLNAWKFGLKGVTVYRDGSRSGVLIDSSKNDVERFLENDIIDLRNQDRIITVHAPKRPDKLKCEIYHTSAKGVRWTVLIGLLKDLPYEVWAFINPNGEIKDKEGIIYKYKKGHYRLESLDGTQLIPISLNDLMSDEEENLTRQISLGLRTGADIKWVVKSLNKSKGTIVSFAKAISRILNKFVKLTEADLEKMDKKCPECEDPDGLIFENGCTSCKSCGFQKCS